MKKFFAKKLNLLFGLKSLFAKNKKLKYFLSNISHYKLTCQSYKLITTMTTIMINQTAETAVKTMLNKHATDCVKMLAEKYGFDLDEALRELDLESTKVVKKERASPKSEPKSTEPKGKAKAKAEKEPKEKKARKPSGYQAFMKAMRPEVKEELEAMTMSELQAELELEDEPEKFHPKHVMTCLGKRWKAQSKEEQDEWNDAASSGAESD